MEKRWIEKLFSQSGDLLSAGPGVGARLVVTGREGWLRH
jgi:hypothetical protein